MRALILLGGGICWPSDPRLTGVARPPYDLIIAADGGVLLAKNLGLRPHESLGDWDSAPPPPGARIFPTRKDQTDGELALARAVELGAREMVILGGLGGRLDHTLGNLHLLTFWARQGVWGVLWDPCLEVWPLSPGQVIPIREKRGWTLSIQPVAGPVGPLEGEGLDYPLGGITLSPWETRGLSNRVLEDGFLRTQSGDGWVIVQKEGA